MNSARIFTMALFLCSLAYGQNPPETSDAPAQEVELRLPEQCLEKERPLQRRYEEFPRMKYIDGYVPPVFWRSGNIKGNELVFMEYPDLPRKAGESPILFIQGLLVGTVEHRWHVTYVVRSVNPSCTKERDRLLQLVQEHYSEREVRWANRPEPAP